MKIDSDEILETRFKIHMKQGWQVCVFIIHYLGCLRQFVGLARPSVVSQLHAGLIISRCFSTKTADQRF
jgi:hypothetical protein